ncbi:hypothetical protein GCM10023196_093310 [Actinoallomurus vinaceus]|uniref:SseB protein N-terminal domain-containing protein n=1 Tax=Actinoallomurus vinaceus TaxID=1080074 RepID=A0ABP8UR52_9ACTN
MSFPDPALSSASTDGSSDSPRGDSSAREYSALKKVSEGVAWVYVPTLPSKPDAGGGPRQVQFELRALADGTGVLPVFTEQEHLVQQLGEYQPFERMPVLELLVQLSEAQVRVAVNPVVREDAERWSADRIAAWRMGNR